MRCSAGRTLVIAASAWRQQAAWPRAMPNPLLLRRPLLPLTVPARMACSMMCVEAPAAPPAAATESTLDVLSWLAERVREALVDAFGPDYSDADPLIAPNGRPEFGDYQCNVAMPLGKKLKQKPRDIATSLVERLRVDEVFEAVEIAGPGFLNLRLKPSFVQEQLRLMASDEARCAVPAAGVTQRVVVDYSSPNIAKEMHVGHLRSTIIGDCLSRLLEFRGHGVVRLNHVGDWGTQFGMLITHLGDQAPDALAGKSELDISDLVAFYKEAKQRFDADADFQNTARANVVKLQAGDEDSLRAWRMVSKEVSM